MYFKYHTHTGGHGHINSLMYTHRDIHEHTHIHTHTNSHRYTYKSINKHNILTCMYTHSPLCILRHICTVIQIHAHLHINVNTDVKALTYTHIIPHSFISSLCSYIQLLELLEHLRSVCCYKTLSLNGFQCPDKN